MLYEDNWLAHHGVKGQKWGIRRFQNEDGTLTSEGKSRYSDQSMSRLAQLANHAVYQNTNMRKHGHAAEKVRVEKAEKDLLNSKEYKNLQKNVMKDKDVLAAYKKYSDADDARMEYLDKRHIFTSDKRFRKNMEKYNSNEKAADDELKSAIANKIHESTGKYGLKQTTESKKDSSFEPTSVNDFLTKYAGRNFKYELETKYDFQPDKKERKRRLKEKKNH